MKITINGHDYPLYFGLDFIETLDNEQKVEYLNSTEIGVGTTYYIGLLADSRNPKYLVPIIKAAVSSEDTIPTDADIKKWIDTQEDIKNTVDAFLLNLQKASLLQEMANWKAVKIQNKEALKMFLG